MGSALQQPTLQSYNPTWRDRLAHALLGDSPSLGAQNVISGLLGSTGLGSTGMSVADLTPVGGIFGAQDAAQHGDYQGAAVAGLGALPGWVRPKIWRWTPHRG